MAGQPQLLDLGVQFGNRLFEIEEIRVHSATFAPRSRRKGREYSGSGRGIADVAAEPAW
jgi:hypothetical protein